MMVTFPLEIVFLTSLALWVFPLHKARALLFSLWISQLIMSAGFVNYIHVNEGSTSGDYGDAYHKVMKKR